MGIFKIKLEAIGSLSGARTLECWGETVLEIKYYLIPDPLTSPSKVQFLDNYHTSTLLLLSADDSGVEKN